MTAIRKIADKLGKPRVALAEARPREEYGFDLAYESSQAISRYPTITFVCLMAGSGVLLALAAASLVALLILAIG
jgi:hypothetical protein